MARSGRNNTSRVREFHRQRAQRCQEINARPQELASQVVLGAASVALDIGLGLERGFEMLGGKGFERANETAREHVMMGKLLYRLVRVPFSSEKHPLYKLVEMALAHLYENFPYEAAERIAKEQGLNMGAFYAGRMGIGDRLAARMARDIARRVASLAAYRTFTARIAAGIAASGTGVGIPLAVLGYLGMAQRASEASGRLHDEKPLLWKKLREADGLDLVFFMAEEAIYNYECKLGFRKKQPFMVYRLSY